MAQHVGVPTTFSKKTFVKLATMGLPRKLEKEVRGYTYRLEFPRTMLIIAARRLRSTCFNHTAIDGGNGRQAG